MQEETRTKISNKVNKIHASMKKAAEENLEKRKKIDRDFEWSEDLVAILMMTAWCKVSRWVYVRKIILLALV